MQFGSQHPGGLGVPTVGMALPGYVAQQQMGMGNNEMTWYVHYVLLLPVVQLCWHVAILYLIVSSAMLLLYIHV
jgi:hypothetical protein